MAKQDSVSITTRLGGNRTLVLLIVISMLLLFTVDTFIVPALGGGGSRAPDYVRYTVGGRRVELSMEKFQSAYGDWQKFQAGQTMLSGRPRQGGTEEFLADLMIGSLAAEAGVSVPDDTVREFIATHPLFQDRSGDFDRAVYAEARKRFFNDIPERAFEQEARRHLLVDHYTKIYANSFMAVGDDECWQRWKANHPKVEVAYAWQPVAPVREGMKPEDVAEADLEAFWKDPAVQTRHRTQDRRAFEAAAVRAADCEDGALEKAREEWKGEASLALGETEAFEFWSQWRSYDFDLEGRSPEEIAALRKENEARVDAEDEAHRKRSEEERRAKQAEKGLDPSGEEPAPVVDPYDTPPLELEEREQFRLYWRARVEKEVFLRKLLERVRLDASPARAPGAPAGPAKVEKGALEAAVAKWSRPGLGLRFFRQETPVDQYEVEKMEGLGLPNCPLRYALNDKKAEDVGVIHPEILQRTASTSVLEERGWVIFVPTDHLPAVVPPLADVRGKVLEELLSRRARDEARSRLSRLRKAAEDGRLPLEEAAKAEGIATAAAGPFNEYTWRPPLAKDALKDEASRAAAWKDEPSRLSAVLSRYYTFREVPAGGFSEVLDDAEGTGALYLVQVKARTDPAFEEMTQAQLAAERRSIGRQRLQDLAKELSYAGLKDRLSLFLDGKPAPEPEEMRRGGG